MPRASGPETVTIAEAFRVFALVCAAALDVPIGACSEVNVQGRRWSLHVVDAETEDGCDEASADPPPAPKGAGNGGRGRPPSGCKRWIVTALADGEYHTVKQLAGDIRRAGGPDFSPSTLRDNLTLLEAAGIVATNQTKDAYGLA
jgi:hypothetical protein